VMCCSLWFLSFTFGLRVFSTVLPNSTYESRDWVMCCSLWFTFILRVFFNSSQFPPMKAGIEWCAALCVLSLRLS
jgi:hypothetical protein